MEINHQPDIWQTINDLGSEPGIECIRIYDKQGVIRYSTNHEEVGSTVDVKADACTMCHGSATQFTKTTTNQYARIYESGHGHRVLGFINPIQNERSCSDAACHAHAQGKTYLGVLDVQMSLSRIDQHIASSSNLMLWSAIITLLVVALVSGGFVYIGIHKPVKKVIAGTKEFAAGNLLHTINIRGNDEIGELARSFNSMGESLHNAKSELVTWSNTLEQKVDQKTRELHAIQQQIVHMEKMASLGKLSSMIAHELNNPLSGILTYAKLINKRLAVKEMNPEKMNAISGDLSFIADEAKRCGDIVKNLLFFARSNAGEFSPTDIDSIIDKALRLIQHQIDMQQIAVIRHSSEIPFQVHCDQNQVQQALLALLINAVEAMPDGGTLTVRVVKMNQNVHISIRDTGTGISESDKQHIFEPFFTTKESGAGTGLGLAIVYGIFKNHGGDVHVESEIGKGSTFTVTLPMKNTYEPHTQPTHP